MYYGKVKHQVYKFTVNKMQNYDFIYAFWYKIVSAVLLIIVMH